MQGRPDFRLYHGNALDVLAGLLAAEIARAPADGDWLRPDIVLVPQFSMRRWLQQALAEATGICANLRFLTPGEFVDLALDANLGPAPPEDRLDPDTLRWHVLRELQRRPPPALARFLDGDDVRKPWSLANALADTYEKYQAWRRDWLRAWEQRPPKDDWEATLWRNIARDRAHRARRVGDYLARFGEDGTAPVGLPPRLFVFACQNVSPDVLQVIASQSRAGTQHFYLHSPARGFWGDIGRWARYAPADDDAFLGDGTHTDAPNPLLAAWGQAGRDFVAMLVGGDIATPSFDIAPFVEPVRDTLLGRMQADLLDNRAALRENSDAAWPRVQVDKFDASLQFHACHTRLREVQVLHDQLRALLEAEGREGEPPLQPRDIAVLAPDIDAYAPHIEAVFGGALGTARELPYTIADTSPLASAPIAEAFLRLLELPLRAPSLADVLDLLAVPAIAARFGLEDADRMRVQDWLESAGARWGLDARDRQRHGAEGEAYTLEFAIDRLLLGYASGDGEDIAGIAPWPELEGQAAESLDALLRCVAMLRDARTQLTGPHAPAKWATLLERLLGEAFAPARDTADAALLRRLRDAIGRFSDGAARADYDTPVEHAIVLEQLRTELGSADARAPFLSGGICFGRMVPMRLIPFRVVCLLGMDAEAFPAFEGRDPINRIANALGTKERRTGDPSRRDADRYLFLQLFASAGRVLSLSWCGMDPRDNSRREPSTLVAELLDTAAAYHGGDPDHVRETLVVRHALQPFSPSAYGAPHAGEVLAEGDGTEPRRFSYDAAWQAASTETAGTDASPPFAPVTLRLPARDLVHAPLSLDRLRRSLMRPHAVYLQEGLGLRLPEDEAPLAEHEPLGAPDALEQYALRNAVFDAWLRASGQPDAHVLHARLLARALVAPGAEGRAQVAKVLEEIAPFAMRAVEKGFSDAPRRRAVAHASSAGVLRGTLDGVHRDRVLRVVLRPDGVHGGHAIRHGLDRLCASLLGLPMYELAKPSKDDAPEFNILKPLTEKRAIAALDSLFAWHDAALRAPQVFLPKSAHDYVQVLAEKDAVAALRAARQTWTGDRYGQTERAEATAATHVALRGRDPFIDEDVESQLRFARLAEAVFRALGQDAVPLDAEVLE
ncbi:exodeoxyribonuclease V subunit gamma [Lysobacter sp. KIS68-7]|uniref:exodeoxyribonuclease V subunit gamma n=1 Tax=Lysobacter sp. KIS68-7 TaxID=2904252 RepID=UPI001E4FBC66|nr:exodeoxyribonuclease V subunit gamma [Lysobacter sp. KIS68-7]UHQ20483.1 exodeoxyribonuclease V subunit gamma [Lysobacter sp. KIS68-7]